VPAHVTGTYTSHQDAVEYRKALGQPRNVDEWVAKELSLLEITYITDEESLVYY
jgi:hypothetical protein